MITVADTSPLCYLVLINEVDLLRKLFSEVVVPAAVISGVAPRGRPGGSPRLGGQSPAVGFCPGESDSQYGGVGETSGW